MNYFETIEAIKAHQLGNKEEACSLYNSFCDLLKEKYGAVDRDYDDQPLKRGKEWLDIHHILEYELDNIAQRTDDAQWIKKEQARVQKDECVIGLKRKDFNEENMKLIRNIYKDKNVRFYGLDYTLEELKPYNAKDKLVYANKIEHFLLHYLIDSIRGQNIFSGGTNYTWDNAVALDVYGSDLEYINSLKERKEEFYSIMSSVEITKLYKEVIDWKEWEIQNCRRYWLCFNDVLNKLSRWSVSYVEDLDKLFQLFEMVGYDLDSKNKAAFRSSSYKVMIINWSISDGNIKAKVIRDDCYSMDEKTILQFHSLWGQKTFTVPKNIEIIGERAFYNGLDLRKITIPVSVKKIDDEAFFIDEFFVLSNDRQILPKLEKIYYHGTREMWDANFSNVKLENVAVVCRKKLRLVTT
jgi:hypothetical protein